MIHAGHTLAAHGIVAEIALWVLVGLVLAIIIGVVAFGKAITNALKDL